VFVIDAIFLGKLNELYQALRENDGVLTIWMKELKDLHGPQRLGNRVRDSIERHLAERGIAIVGEVLPNSESASVRLYLKGTRVARLIEAVELKGAAGDQLLRELATTSFPTTTRELIQKLKALVSEYDLE
jgi:hypothetical protein